MFRSFLSLLLMAVFVSVAVAQQGHTDVQSLQYEFGKSVSTTQLPPCNCKPVVYAPVNRGCCYCCTPCYSSCYVAPRCYPAPKVYRRACVRPVYSPYYCW